MPVIKNYSPQVQVDNLNRHQRSRRDDFGEAKAQADVNVGRQVGNLGGELVKRANQIDVSNINAKTAELQLKLSMDYEEKFKGVDLDGDDYQRLTQEMQEHTEAELSKLSEEVGTLNGNAHFAARASQIKGLMFNKANQGQNHLAGVKAELDNSKTVNALAQDTRMNPAHYRDNILSAQLKSQGQRDTGLLNAEGQALFDKQDSEAIAREAIKGWADMDTTKAMEELKSGAYDKALGSQANIDKMEKYVEHVERANEVEAERKRIQDKRLKDEADDKLMTSYLDDMHEPQGLSTQTVLDSNLGFADQKMMLGMIDSQNKSKKKLQTDPTLYLSIMTRINLPDGDPNKITDEKQLNQYLGNGLSLPDLKAARGEIQGKGTAQGKVDSDMKKELISFAKSQMTQSDATLKVVDAEGDKNFHTYMNYFLPEYQKQRAAGKTAAQLLDRNSPDYLGKVIKQFTKTGIERIRFNTRSLRAPRVRKDRTGKVVRDAFEKSLTPIGVKRLPGESYSDFKKRTRGSN